jgi:hypothetical protein
MLAPSQPHTIEQTSLVSSLRMIASLFFDSMSRALPFSGIAEQLQVEWLAPLGAALGAWVQASA